MIVQGSHAVIGIELTRLKKREKGKEVFFKIVVEGNGTCDKNLYW